VQKYIFPFLALALSVSPLPSAHAQVTTPATAGQWQNGPNFPFFPVHMHLMRTGKIIMWPGDDGISGNDPRLFDPATNAVTPLAQPGYDVFCSGHSFLPDGRLFVAGGHISNNVGLPSATIYDPLNNTWTKQPNMNLGRWYPTDQVLPNGDVLVVSGDVDLSTGNDPLPQVFNVPTGSWRDLSNAQLQLGLYPTLSLAPNGMVFNSGPSVITRYLDTTGTGSWTTVGNHVYQGYRDYDGMAMYQPGKILVAGGNDPATKSAEVIDLNASQPAWRAVSSMAFARRQMNMTMLPDGKVLVTGGTSGPGFSNPDPTLASYAAEEWDPATEQWTTLSSATVPRLYHSIAMLLPDGRVLTTGGNTYTQTEYFSPPYLFAGARPTIASAPTDVRNGQSVFVGTPDAVNITSVAWVRLPSVTHTLSMSQAFYRSTAITQATGGITVTAPNDPTMPNGFYMLFILNHGVPSVASILHLGATSVTAVTPVATSLSPNTAQNGASPFPLTVNGSNFTTDSIVQYNGVNLPTTFISNNQISGMVPASDLATPGTGQVTVFTPAPGGGGSAALTFTVGQASVPNLTQTGSIIARITAPTGGGNKSLEVIRDGDMPPVGSNDGRRQYDTYSGGAPATEDWIGYQYAAPQTFAKVIFQEGMNFPDGGYFNNLIVQVRQNGTWVNVSGFTSTPAYPPNDGVSYETYTLNFAPITGDAVRIDGAPGGTSYFTSVGELQVFGPAASAANATLSSLSPATANNGDSPFKLTVNGSNFVSGAMVQWNGSSRPTTYVSSAQLVASIPASDVATAGTAQIGVVNPSSSRSSSLTFTVNQAPVPNLTQTGAIIARIMTPTGGGSKNLEVIRDGDKPPVSTNDSSRQYDSYSGGAPATDDWIGYQYTAPQTFAKVVFQEGRNFGDGGWFNSLTVQVRQNGSWVNVSGLVATPAYPPNDNISFESYTLSFNGITGDAIRIDGAPGGTAYFISVGELEIYGPPTSTVGASSLSPASANSGDSPFKLTVNGSSFVSGATVQWNGANRATTFINSTQLIASIPAGDVAGPGTAQVTVALPNGGTSSPLTFTINQAAVPNLTQTGTIIAHIMNPTGGGNKNLEVIRDGDKPPVGTNDSSRQYDSYSGGAPSTDDWIGYQYTAAQTFTKVVFQEGMNFVDGGWFNSGNVQVRQNGAWVNVSNLVSTPAYPANDGISFESYTFTFDAITGDAIRIDGPPGGSAYFMSVGELEVYGR
jgi:hypothetical protein